MFEFLHQHAGPQSQGLHYSFEKAGLVFDNQPIPWNAEAVLIEASLRIPPQQPRTRDDFTLRVGEAGPIVPAENLRPGDTAEMCRLFFRLPTPAQATSVEVRWRDRSLGQLALPFLSAAEFLLRLSLQMPSLSAQLGSETVQCQTAVTTQCQGVLMAALVSSPFSLVPILDLGLRVRMCSEKGDLTCEAPVHFSCSQLRGKQALVTVLLSRPRRAGAWLFHWLAGDKVLATQQLRTVSKAAVPRSLRLSATRFVLQHADGQLNLTQNMPTSLAGITRVGPCFWVSSSELGLASWCELEVRARINDGGDGLVLQRQKLLVGDGPTPVALGTLDIGFLQQIKHFELYCQTRLLGRLPLVPVPTADFTAEGGFHAPEDFVWSPAAEEQLQEKLGRLLGKSG